jgi:hypothetical protein
VAAFVKRNLAHFPPMTEEQVAHVLVLMREGDREKARGVAGDDARTPPPSARRRTLATTEDHYRRSAPWGRGDATTYLRSKGVDVFRASGSEVTIHCLFCPDGDPKGKGKLYINSESWLYDCKRCGERGGRRRLLEHFGDVDEQTYEPGQDPARRRQVLEEYTAHAEELLLGNEGKLLYLLRRGLSAETIAEAASATCPRTTA